MMRCRAVQRRLLLLCFVLISVIRPAPAEVRQPALARTLRIKIAFDEEYRRRPARAFEIRRWVSFASYFFEKNFGLRFRIQSVGFWPSDNTKDTLLDLLGDLQRNVGRDGCDIVVGVTSQVTGSVEPSGLASYLQGYVLMRRLRGYEVNHLTLIHELCHLFGAVDLDEKNSVMNKARAGFNCDTFTREIVLAHQNRRFDGLHFPLASEDMDSAIALYAQRKALGRPEAGVWVMLALFYMMKDDPEQAIQACLQAWRIEPNYPGLQIILNWVSQKRNKETWRAPAGRS